jgi:hypothetical protein
MTGRTPSLIGVPPTHAPERHPRHHGDARTTAHISAHGPVEEGWPAGIFDPGSPSDVAGDCGLRPAPHRRSRASYRLRIIGTEVKRPVGQPHPRIPPAMSANRKSASSTEPTPAPLVGTSLVAVG